MYLHSTYCFYIGIYTIRIILLYLEYAYNAVVVMQYVTKMEEPYNSLTYVRVFRVLNIAKSFDQYYKMFIAKETGIDVLNELTKLCQILRLKTL